MLHSGDDYTVLKESYVIFITENDVMGGGLPLYHIDRYCFELDERFNDGNHIIYVNGAYHDLDTPIGKLMHDFKQTQADQMYYQILKEGMKHYKESEGGRDQMCKAVEEYANEMREKGIAEGKAEGNVEGVIKLAKNIGLNDEEIVQKLIEMFNMTSEKANHALKGVIL